MTNSVDAKVFALIAIGTTTVIGILKQFFPKLVTNREEAIAQLLPILFTVIAKSCGLFHATEWVDALIFAMGGGLVSGTLHDKAVNPVKRLLKALFGGAGDPGAPPVEEKKEPPK